MSDLQLNNQTNNDYTFGPYHLLAGNTQTVTIDTTTSASLYLIDDAFADVVNALVAGGQVTVQAGTGPTPFPRVTGVPQLLHGDGTPEGVHFAPSGSAFMRRDNSGASNALYAKTTGPSLSTGWQAFAGSAAPAPSTSLPGSPSNGQQAILVDSTSAPTYAWLLQYSTAASKWLFIGGSPFYAEVTTSEATTSTSYAALTTAGPSIALSRAGTYVVSHGFEGLTTGQQTGYMSYDIGGTGAVDADATQVGAGGGGTENIQVVGTRTRQKSSIGASTTLTAKYKVSAATSYSFAKRWMSVIPVFVT